MTERSVKLVLIEVSSQLVTSSIRRSSDLRAYPDSHASPEKHGLIRRTGLTWKWRNVLILRRKSDVFCGRDRRPILGARPRNQKSANEIKDRVFDVVGRSTDARDGASEPPTRGRAGFASFRTLCASPTPRDQGVTFATRASLPAAPPN